MARKGSENNPRSEGVQESSSVDSNLTKSKSELDLVKNKSNLYLIKSYSFIGETSKPNSCNKIHGGKHSEVTDLDEIHELLMYDAGKKTSQVLKVKGKSRVQRQQRQEDQDDFECDESLLRKKSARKGILRRPKSLPTPGSNMKRESFFRQSFQNIRRSFIRKPAMSGGVIGVSSSSSGGSERMQHESDFEGDELLSESGGRTHSNLGDLKEEEDETRISRSTSIGTMAEKERSTSSVSTLSHSAPGSPMAPLQGHSETQSVNCLNTIGKSSSQFLTHPITSSTIPVTIGSKGDNKSVRQSTSTALTSASSSANLPGLSPNPRVTIVSKNDIPEKEKKRKELSSSRLKKFHRHFQQVSKDERVINYFSCALVSDILLQGHLYITDNHFAFYSNVFGYVTKVVIPTSSVTKISKEKTAKIIPNAVGVATADERHVFGSFISRESAFRLMCSVCPPLAPIQLIPKALPDVEISEECSIEDDSSCSISGNESPPQPIDSGAATTTTTSDASQTLLRRKNKSGDVVDGGKGDSADKRLSEPLNAKNTLHPNTEGNRASAPPTPLSTNNSSTSSTAASKQHQQKSSTSTTTTTTNTTTNASTNSSTLPAAAIVVGNVVVGASSSFTSTSSTSSASSAVIGQTSSSSSSSPNTVVSSSSTAFKAFSQSAIVRLKFPTEFHIVYLGVVLSIILAIFSGFLLYRILDIEAKTSLYRSPVEFNWGSGNDADIFAEALRWQKELQTKSTEEAQNILHTNLQQIAKVRRSLETLSMLIHDRSSSSSSAYEAEGGVDRDDTD